MLPWWRLSAAEQTRHPARSSASPGQQYAPRLQKQLFTRDLGRKRGTVAGQRQTNRLVQAVHGVCGKHARTGTARGAGVLLNLGERGITHGIVHRHDHRIHQIQAVLHNAFNALAGFHGTARHENCGDIQAHRCQEHAGVILSQFEIHTSASAR